MSSQWAKTAARQFRATANEAEQEAARLKHEARVMRDAAYTLHPIGRKPGSRKRKAGS